MSIRDDLKLFIDDSRIIEREKIEDSFLSDTLGRLKGHADALVFPLSTEEVSKIVRYAYDRNISITTRGAGTNLVGSTVPTSGGIIIDLSRMNKVLELDKETFTITVEPGILLQDLQAIVEEAGLFYPPDPGEKTASIGGNISTNAGGMRAVKYGVTRDYVRGLEIVLADGTVTTVGTKNVKDASGLSLKNFIIGSEGTLAIITKAILRLIPKPEYSETILIPYANLKTGIESVIRILQANANPTAVEFVDRDAIALGEKFTGISYPHPEAGSYIIITLDGKKSECEANREIVKRVAIENGAIDFLPLSKEETPDIWKVRGSLVKAVESFSEQEPIDIVVPINKSAEFIAYIKNLEKETGVKMISFGHAGDGNVHLCVLRENRDDETWERELHGAMDKAYHEAYRLGGLASAEHGIGLGKRRYFLRETSKTNLAMMNSIKDALDPKHILNDGISYIVEKN